MSYGFFFDYEGETIQLPLNPAKLTVRTGSKNKTIDLISIGEFSILKDIPLKEFSFKILLPSVPYPFVHTLGDFKEADFFLNKFEEYKRNKKPVRFIVVKELPSKKEIEGINTLVSLEEYTADENGGEEGDIWVDMKLKEYREITSTVLTIQSNNTATKLEAVETVNRPAKEFAGEYTVKSGDCLWAIAKREINDGSRFKEIADLNGIKDPNLIMPGQILKLPPKG